LLLPKALGSASRDDAAVVGAASASTSATIILLAQKCEEYLQRQGAGIDRGPCPICRSLGAAL
jgi:hypothetical protein